MSLEPSDGDTLVWAGPGPAVTTREATILELAAAGWSTRRMAELLSVSEQAITYHLGNLLAKFGAGNRAGLVGRAFVFGYLLADDWPPRVNPEVYPD